MLVISSGRLPTASCPVRFLTLQTSGSEDRAWVTKKEKLTVKGVGRRDGFLQERKESPSYRKEQWTEESLKQMEIWGGWVSRHGGGGTAGSV